MRRAIKRLNDFLEREMLKGISDDTLKRKRKELLRFLEYIGCPLNAERPDIIEYIRTTGENLPPKLVNRKLTYLRQFFDYLATRGDVLLNPVMDIPQLKETESNSFGVFTENEVRDILEAAEDENAMYSRKKSLPIMTRDRAILKLLYSTGLRSNELINLDADDVDFRNREITVRKGKLEKERIVPAGDEALKALMEYLKAREKLLKPGKEYEALFISRQGNRLSSVGVRKMIQKRKQEAGVKSRGTTHAFRHSFASHILKRGAPIEAIKRILGHENIETTERYTHVADIDLVSMYRDSHPRAGRRRGTNQ